MSKYELCVVYETLIRFFALNALPTECLCCNHVCGQRSNSGDQACYGIPYPRFPLFSPVFPRFPHFPHFFRGSKKDLETPGDFQGLDEQRAAGAPSVDRPPLEGHASATRTCALDLRPQPAPPAAQVRSSARGIGEGKGKERSARRQG